VGTTDPGSHASLVTSTCVPSHDAHASNREAWGSLSRCEAKVSQAPMSNGEPSEEMTAPVVEE